MSTTDSSSSPYPRDDWWGDDLDGGDESTGHQDTSGTDPAGYIAVQQLKRLTAPVCGRTLERDGREIELSEPCLYLPKQHATGHGYLEYRQHRHRRRVNPETGWINWGESTSTAIPSVDKETYLLAVHTYLAERGALVTKIEPALELAHATWHDPGADAVSALTTVIKAVREDYDDTELPDA